MSEKTKKLDADRESILLALDQLHQTMEVMRQVVNRLRRSVEQAHTHMAQAEAETVVQPQPERQEKTQPLPVPEMPFILH